MLHTRDNMFMIGIMIGINALLFVNAGWDISMVVTNTVSGALGGEPFSVQPTISIFDLKGSMKRTNLNGRVVATLEHSSSPTIQNELLGIESNLGHCYVDVNNEISTPVLDGEATFVGLCVNTASIGYSIRYTLKDEHNITLGFVTGTPFIVNVGNPYQIGVIQCPQEVSGGTVWDALPIVAVQDRGGNTVESVNEGNVSVALVDNMHAETLDWDFETYSPLKPWVEGKASFGGIIINKAGIYQLNFITDLVLPGAQECRSTNIAVNTGAPHALLVVEEPSENRVYGGAAFITQPKLHIIDRGANVLSYDHSSKVLVSLYSNPVNATLSPSASRVKTSSHGIVQFEHLKIDKNGTGFWFQFELYVFDEDIDDYLVSNISTFGSVFDVEVAPPDHIEFLRLPSSEMWAGNQPFLEQPVLALMDSGGNIVEHENCGPMKAILTESLSQTSEIAVDTTNDDIPGIKSLHFLPDSDTNSDNLYSVGHNISIIVTFSQEVEVILSSNYTTSTSKQMKPPSLELNVIREDNTRSEAILVWNAIPSRQLHFQYTVSENSRQNEVNIISRNALNTNDYIIVDAWNRSCDIILPFPNSTTNLLPSQNISVHSDSAKIINITTDVASGEYAAGHIIKFHVDFNHEVSVQNSPVIPINVKSSIVIIDIAEIGTSYSKSYFYVWYKGQRSISIPWNAPSNYVKNAFERIGTMMGSVCVSRSKSSLNTGGFRWAVRLEDNLDNFSNNGLSIQTADVQSDHEASNISLTYLVTNESLNNWTVIDGEMNMCTDRSASYIKGSGTKTLLFQYQVLPGDRIDELKFIAPEPVIRLGNDTRMTNAINEGTMSRVDVDLNWTDVDIGKEISIEASRPLVKNVHFIGNESHNKIHHAGDKLYFNATFSKKVIVEGIAYFNLDVCRYNNKAYYFTGSGSNNLVFEYTVQPNHWSDALQYDDTPSQIHISSGYIRHQSSHPSLDVDLALPSADSPFQFNVSRIQVDGRTPLITDVFVSEGQAYEFEERDVINISVQFSSEIAILGGPPVLAVSIGNNRFREAPYFKGNNSISLEFQYIVKVGDMSPLHHITCRMLCVSSGCLEGVSTEGYIKQASSNPVLNADLTLPYPSHNWKILNQMPIYSKSGDIQVNTTAATKTKISNISILHQEQVVSIGEVIRIQVTFTDDVYLRGTSPQLNLNTNSSALYESGSGTTIFTFVFTTSIDDVINELNWKTLDGKTTPIICDRFSLRPCLMTNANEDYVDLATEDTHGNVISDLIPKMKIDSTTPRVLSIYVFAIQQLHCQSHCNYTAGDSIIVFIKYDQPVSVLEPNIKIKMNVTDSTSKDPIFATYDKIRSNTTDLAFVYKISEGHSTFGQPLSLQCEDQNSCNIIGSVNKSQSVIRRLATHPTLRADLTLPHQNITFSNKDIFVDAVSIPKVIAVESKNGTGVFSPGDEILFDIHFSEYVHIVGMPVLLLNVGRNQTESAVYVNGSSSKCLTFQYIVKPEHCVPLLDYVDVHSLKAASSDHNNITRQSAEPTIIADLKLPIPGSEGSLRGHSSIKVDCRPPFIMKIWSSNEKGRYSTGDNITIMVEFSRDVVVTGRPTILLEVGKTDRHAFFHSQTNASVLAFSYQIQLGDSSSDLEYWTNEGLNRTSLKINTNGGSIMLPATTPIIHADLDLNPAFGYLGGQKQTQLDKGIARFNGLKIGKRGSKYKIRFQYHSCVANFTYEAMAMMSIFESSEYHLYGNDFDRENGDALGTSVALDGNLLAVGAKNKRNSFSEVQVLTVKADTTIVKNEVQVVSTQVDKVEAIKQIQSFSTSAFENHTISGNFTLSYIDDANYLYAAPLSVPANIGAGQLEVLMQNYFPNLGPVKVTRNKNDLCNCKNAWTWRLTFMDASSGVLPLKLNGSGLIGANGTMHSYVEKNTSMIDGYFTLRNPSNEYETRLIAYDASAVDFKLALEEDLGLVVKSVMAANLDERQIPNLGRRWTIIFSHFLGPNGLDFDIPNLEVGKSILSGTNPYVWTHVGFEGRGQVNGTFAFSFRNSELSPYVPFNASSMELEMALEELASINDVSVSGRKDLSEFSSQSGYTWTITFNSVNVQKGGIWLNDYAGQSVSGNMPPLKVESRLTGWNARITVEYEFGNGKEDTQAQWMAKAMGKDGLRSGHVIMYHGNYRQWSIESFLLPSDGDSNDNFGHSVSLSDSYVAIGAPNKEVYGVYEQQTILCQSKAVNGTFSIAFRGYRSDPIPFNATAQQIDSAIRGVYRNSSNIHSMPEFSLEGSEHWDKTNTDPVPGFCTSTGNNLTITFTTPDGSGLSTMEDVSGDIESLVIDNSELILGQVTMIESRKGTRILSGETKKQDSITTLGMQSGSVYVFRRSKQCEFCPYVWKERIKLTSLNGFDHPQYSAMFGWSTSIAPDPESKQKLLAIGSPGFNNASGKVYTFKGQNHEWNYEYSLSSSLWNDVAPGASFGYSMAMDSNTLLVGSPGHNNKRGSVYVFLRHIGRMGFLASQKISAPSEINEGDEFGHSLSLSEHRAVICAPNHNDTVESGLFKMKNSNAKEEVGSCYVYERQDVYKPFQFMQKLVPTNVRARNRFGYSCDISGDRIIVGQLEKFIEYDFYIKNNSLDVRGRVHLFTYNNESAWTEASYLFPYDPQSDDLFGSSVAIDKDNAVVGAPTRKLLGISSGCVSIFHLSFLNFYFPVSSYEVQEGESLPMLLKRRIYAENEIIGVKSIDKNLDSHSQRYISTLFDFDAVDGLGPSKTAVDLLCGSEAFGRNFGKEGLNNGNLWIAGAFDYRGRSDYAQIDDFFLYQAGSMGQRISLNTTNDMVYEPNDERLCVNVFLPGMFVSALGDKRLDIRIKDDDDGLHHLSIYTKQFFGNADQDDHLFGAAIDFAEDAKTLVISSQMNPNADNHFNSAGSVYIFNKTSYESWNESVVITKPILINEDRSSYFGQSVSIFKFSTNPDLLLLIGAPGHSCAYVFFFDSSNNKWEEEAVLQPFGETYVHAKHNFAGKKSTAISENVAFIGASGLETVFVYRRYIDNDNNVSWKPWSKLKSSDYDFDMYDNGYTTTHIHQQQFGISVSYKDRLLLVGAPYADYGNQGNKTKRETFDTDGVHNKGLGRGRVYVFHSRPIIMKVIISANSYLDKGQFKLDINASNKSFITSAIPINAREEAMKNHIERTTKIGQVDVHMTTNNQPGLSTTKWFIAFKSMFTNDFNVTALWKDNGCDYCEDIEGFNTTNSNATISVEKVSDFEEFTEESILQGDDVTSGDGFGNALHLDKNEAIIGALFSSAKTRTTWDFETGTLAGWVANGNAFDYQPVFGDNSKRRIVYEGFGKPDSQTSGLPQSANVQGRYYIGTFERRPGNASDYLNYDDGFIEGAIQGDLPTGTLTSDPFLILGDEISFLIGGGCDHLTEYIELLVDGFATMRATGQCNEAMERVKWKVSDFKQRAARIRIVDKDDGLWGHINIDDITFSWKSSGINSGGCSNRGGMLPKTSAKSKQHYSGQEESPFSGAAYIFVRNCTASDWILKQQGTDCEWKQDQRITPSDKRPGSLFGSSVSIDSTKGLAVVGSDHAPMFGMYKELPNPYPHNTPWIRFPVKQKLEYLMKSGVTLSPTAGNLRVTNHIMNKYNGETFFLMEKFSEEAGATYLFKRTNTIKSKTDGSLLRAPFWQSFEHAKVEPSDLSGNDWFGHDVKIIGNTVITSSIWHKNCCNKEINDLGAVYLFDIEFYSLRFSQVEYEAIEGSHDKISIIILRDEASTNSSLTVGFATSDLSAAGIDKGKFDECLNKTIEERINCGDYEQTSGYLVFQPGETSKSFDVRVMDDYCWERHLEYIQLNLYIPGGALIQGERYRAQLKIDDDDWLSKNTTKVLCLE